MTEFVRRSKYADRFRARLGAPAVFWLAVLGLLLVLGVPVRAQAPAAARATVSGVVDQTFPRVLLAVDVRDAGSNAITGLPANAFTVQEDGQAAQVLSVTPDDAQPVALVLALDRSTDEVNWDVVRTAAVSLLRGLRPEDRVALIVFDDDVETVQSFTTDKQAAEAVLLGVTAGGEFSASNPAVVEAVDLATEIGATQAAVVVVADVPDNVSTLTADQAAAQIQGAGVPVYMVGFGPRAQNTAEFATIAAASGGQAVSVADAAGVGPVLGSVAAQVRLGYQVEFLSALPADNRPHTALVTVQTPAGQLQDQATFTARPGEVVVVLPGWSDGQPVAGVINLTSVITTPAPLVSVEYQLDNSVIGSAADATTPVVWDTAAAGAGDHTLRAVALDSAGNEGRAEVRVQVVPPATSRLEMAAVDSNAYPEVAAYADAFGGNGLPVAGLNSTNFAVRVDNRAVPPEQVATQVDASQPLQLVLALDRSATPGDWAQLRNAANSLIDGMRPQDQMALYAYAATPSLVQPPTADRNALKSALATVEPAAPGPQGGDNGLNQTLIDATNLAATFPAGRRAVVALADGADDTGAPAAGQTVDVLAAQPVPVHMLAYGLDAPEAALFAGTAQASGGHAAVVPAAGDLVAPLQTLGMLLQQGYRLGFVAEQEADDASHTLSVALVGADLEGEATGTFVARSSPVTVTVPNLAEGQEVGGTVDLTAQAETRAPVTSVAYRLNGDLLAEVDDTSYSIIWDSASVEPGDYVLDVTVTDAAGNEGSATVSFVVAPPITLSAQLAARNSDGEIFIGDEVTIEAEVESLSGDAEVQVYVDQALAGSDDRAPYAVSFPTADLDEGEHTVTVVANDGEGHEVRSTLELPLVALVMPTPTVAPVTGAAAAVQSIDWRRWLTYTAMGVIVVLALIVLWALMRALRRAVTDQKPARMRLSLSNLGNVASAYLLRGEDPTGLMAFSFSVNGVALGMPPVARTVSAAPAASAAAAVGATGATPGPAAPALGGVSVPQNMGDVVDKIGEVSAVARIIADILMSVAYFLPPTLARSVRQIVMQIRRGQMLGRRVQAVQRQVDRLNKTEMGSQMVRGAQEAAGEAGRVATSGSTQQTVATAGQSIGTTVSTATGTAAAGAQRAVGRFYTLGGPAAGGAASGNGAGGAAPAWVYLPPVNPGATVTVDVLVAMRKRPKKTDHYPFRLISRALDQEQGEPEIEQGSVRLEGPGWWRRLLWVIFVLVIVVAAAAIVWLLLNR